MVRGPSEDQIIVEKGTSHVYFCSFWRVMGGPSRGPLQREAAGRLGVGPVGVWGASPLPQMGGAHLSSSNALIHGLDLINRVQHWDE